jgi:DNA-binding CsgD family transcriptional regulator
MREARELTDLIEQIYGAALEPALWNEVVAGINDFVGGQACGIISNEPTSRSGQTQYYGDADPHDIRPYAENHSRFDPVMALPAPGPVMSIPDLADPDEDRHGRFGHEWLRPPGCVDADNVALDRAGPNCAAILTVLSGARMIDEDRRRRIAQIIPHVQRALLINRTINLKQSEAATLAAALDGLSAAIFLVDAGCWIVHANTAGRGLLGADDPLLSVGGQLAARDRQSNQTLRDVLGDKTEALAARGTALPLTAHDGERYVMHVLPLTSAARTGFGITCKAVAALFVRRVAMENPCDELVARTFELTPAELRVLRAIVEVGGVPETAAALGVAETTVKTHLHRVFSKTDTSRQADLVKLAAGFASPLAN